MSDLTDEDAIVPAPEQTSNDVMATKLTYGSKRVAIRVSYADLQKIGEAHGFFVDMFTPEKSRHLQLSAFPGDWSGQTQMYTAKWKETSCDGVRHEIDYADDVMKVSFPARCLGSPRWVNFRVVAFAEDDGSYYDDALSDDPISSVDGNWLSWSGRVHRG